MSSSVPTADTCAFVIGEALIDAVHQDDGSAQEYPGGSPANVALTLGRLGRDAQLLTWFGRDDRGKELTSWLAQSNVYVAPGSDQAGKTSVAHATIAQDGSATYRFDLDPQVPAGAVVPTNAIVVHTGSIAAVLEPGGSDVTQLLTNAQSSATITYDPNVRPSLMGTAAAVRPIIENYVRLADVVKVSDEDLDWLYPGQDPILVAHSWQKQGTALVIVTLGGSGATGISNAGTISVSVPKVTVADTVGAGDSFMGALIHGLWEDDLLGAANRDALGNISTAILTRILEQCTRVAAVTVSQPGANPPWLDELTAN